MQSTPVLAVDGGGTRCRVAGGSDGTLAAVETGSANVSSDFEGAVAQVIAGLKELSARLELPFDTLCSWPAYVGLAGAIGDEQVERVRRALPLGNARITDDRPAAVRGALGRRDGVLAHCGTGSFFAIQREGTMRLTGGWGPVLGDEASAQWVGRHALAQALTHVDGFHPGSELTKDLLRDLGGPSGIVRFAGSAGPAELGALARRVTAAAEVSDPVAYDLMRLGSEEIARTVRELGWRSGEAICLTGGIGPHYAAFLPGELRACLVSPEGDPLQGAVDMARDFAQEIGY